jgi:hypothetical protein
VFSVSDDEYREFKRRIREGAERAAKALGKPSSSTVARVVTDFGALFLDFMEHGDRAVAIMIGVALEEASREVMQNYLVDDKVSRTLLQRDGPLGSHSGRVRLAYALGLIPQWLCDDLLVLRDIRNECAHERARFFTKRPLSTLINRLQAGEVASREATKTFGDATHARLFLAAGMAWVYLRVWAGVLREEFRCQPLPKLKASELRRIRYRQMKPLKA